MEESEPVGAARESHDHIAEQLRALRAEVEAQFEETGSIHDLDLLIQVASAAVDLLPKEHPEMLTWLNDLGHWLGRRSERNGSVEDLDRAIATIQAAAETVRVGDAIRPMIWTNLGNRLGKRFERTGSINHLDRAIEATKTAIDAAPTDDAYRAGRLNNLGVWLGKRYERLGSIDDLNQAIDFAGAAVEAAREDPTSRFNWMVSLGNKLGARFQRTGSIEDLNRSIETIKAAKEAVPREHPSRPIVFNCLGNQLAMRFTRTGNIDDLSLAIEVMGIAAEEIRFDHPDRAAILHNLANKFGVRFNHTGSMGDLDKAIENAVSALAITPQDHYDRAMWLTCLGGWLGSRYDQSGSLKDLNHAIDIMDMALKVTPGDEPLRAGRLANLGTLLTARFAKTGSVEDLHHAVESSAEAFEATPNDHPDRILMASSLGISAIERSIRTGSTEDLDRAIDYFRIAAESTPGDSPDRASRVNNLGLALVTRYERTGLAGSLDQAIDVLSTAAKEVHEGNARRARVFHSLGKAFWRRFERSGSNSDLEQAIKKLEVAVRATPLGHPDQVDYHNDIGAIFAYLAHQGGSEELFNRSIDYMKAAVNATDNNEPNRARWSLNLGNWLEERYKRGCSADDLAGALASYLEGWGCYTAAPSIRIELAQRVARILALQSEWEKASQVLHEAVYLVRYLSPQSLRHTDKQRMLASCADLARTAAAIALNAEKDPGYALQLLEVGRGVISGSLAEMRTDISELERHHPALAAEFIRLRDELDSPYETPGFILPAGNTPLWQSRAKRRHESDQKFGELVARIREQPGFGNFLLPATLDEIKSMADPDPIVVINLSTYRCDAFLVEHDQIRQLGLPALTLEDTEKRVRDLRTALQGSSDVDPAMLEWLWNAACRPILEALGFTGCPTPGRSWPRVWWVPTGLLSLLPLHAAGRYAKGSTETVLDRVMSSYSSSIKAMQYGRRDRARASASASAPGADRALLVAMPVTPGLATGALPFAADEVSMLRGMCESLELEPVCPQPLKDAVLSQLGSCKIFHFAGHGRSDSAEPSSSCLLLQDWEENPLTLGDLRDCKFYENQPFLGYLSACSTGASDADKLADEGIHLVSTLQLAGFRHVVGTLWKVSDSHCADIARVFYETLGNQGMTDAAVSLGLHTAIRALRDSQINDRAASRDGKLLEFGTHKNKRLVNTFWVPYVYYGA
ncbi:hypothetical protein MFIFM68171_07359 [Madurella fahalii]|uniref:CHAT domain-containing protein n=1 Tax=Madurella fahalii TaxID=1157608 RepID=A0ABQ0GHD0_9PEZI